MTLSIHADHHGDQTVLITLSGVVEESNAPQIPGAVHATIVRWAPQAVLIDVAAVTLLDSAGIGALLPPAPSPSPSNDDPLGLNDLASHLPCGPLDPLREWHSCPPSPSPS